MQSQYHFSYLDFFRAPDTWFETRNKRPKRIGQISTPYHKRSVTGFKVVILRESRSKAAIEAKLTINVVESKLGLLKYTSKLVAYIC